MFTNSEDKFNVMEEILPVYDMIISRDLMTLLKIDIKYSSSTVEWFSENFPIFNLLMDFIQQRSCIHVSSNNLLGIKLSVGNQIPNVSFHFQEEIFYPLIWLKGVEPLIKQQSIEQDLMNNS